MRVAAASIGAHRIPSSVMKETARSGNVRAFLDVRTKARAKSFHDRRNEKTPVATTPGATSGR